MTLEPHKVKPQNAKDLNTKHAETMKLLEGNIGRTLFSINIAIFLDPSSQEKET